MRNLIARARLESVCLLLATALVVAACGSTQPVRLPPPLQQAPPPAASVRAEAAMPMQHQAVASEERASASPAPRELVRSQTPSPPDAGRDVAGVDGGIPIPPLRGEPINVNIEGVPLPAFIDEFFGNILGVSFQISPALARSNDLITLRTSGPLSPQNFYRLAVQVLRTYGVATRYEGGRVLFTPAAQGGDFDPPLILSGRALPDVPVSHRPVFYLVELQSVRTNNVSQWLRAAFATDRLKIDEDLSRNAIILHGPPDIVRQAVDAIRVFDRPFMRGRSSVRLEPAYVPAEALARRLVDVLNAEGYAAGLQVSAGAPQASSITVLPLADVNAVLLFASDPALLEHAVLWARNIDSPNPLAGAESLFYYTVENTKAQEIVDTLNGIRAASAARMPARDALSAAEAGARSGADVTAAPAPQTVPGSELPPGAITSGGLGGGVLLLDEPRNAIVFQGSASDWGRLLPLVRRMDRAARQVMIEVTIAEVSLNDNEEFGVSWLAKAGAGRFNGTVTSGVLGGPSSGFGGLTYLLDIAGQARAQLRAYAEDNRVTVLSTPRLMVKSGEEASIDVGTEVPTITAQTTSNQQIEGTSNLLQTVQYRKTGIILNIKPVVYSDNRVDIEIRQEVSEALPLSADSAVQSPAIFNRAVSTNLSLRDGSSIILGGLMSRRATDVDGGVPYLKDVPLVGSLFRNRTRNNSRTELVLMLVPYIVESDSEARSLTRALGERYQLVDIPLPPLELTPSRRVPATGDVQGDGVGE